MGILYDEYLEHFSPELSEEIKKYTDEEAMQFSRYIFTRREKKHQYGYCTHCHNEYKTVGLRHNEKAECPHCHSECTVKSSGRGRKYMVDESYFVYYQKSVKDSSVITARGIYVVRDYRFDYKNIDTQYSNIAFYIFKPNESVMLKRDCYYSCAGTFYEGALGKGKSIYSLFYKDHIGNIYSCYSRKSLQSAIENTPFKYSTWESYNYEDMTRFLDLFSKYPGIEYLTKEKLQQLVISKLDNDRTFRTVNWKANSIFKILKLTKQEFREIKERSIIISFYFLYILQTSKKNNWKLTISEIEYISCQYGYVVDFELLTKLSAYGSARKIIKYLVKQNKITIHFFSIGDAVISWRDYIKDCKKLNMDTSKENVLFPKNLYAAHQNTIKQIKVLANEALNKKISKRIPALEKYCFQYLNLLIRPAESSNELIAEGKTLHHCVGTYAEKYANGTTNIFFIRKVADPNKSYYTLELSRKNGILQIRGKNNCSPNKEVSEFIEAFKAVKLAKKIRNKITVPA